MGLEYFTIPAQDACASGVSSSPLALVSLTLDRASRGAKRTMQFFRIMSAILVFLFTLFHGSPYNLTSVPITPDGTLVKNLIQMSYYFANIALGFTVSASDTTRNWLVMIPGALFSTVFVITCLFTILMVILAYPTSKGRSGHRTSYLKHTHTRAQIMRIMTCILFVTSCATLVHTASTATAVLRAKRDNLQLVPAGWFVVLAWVVNTLLQLCIGLVFGRVETISNNRSDITSPFSLDSYMVTAGLAFFAVMVKLYNAVSVPATIVVAFYLHYAIKHPLTSLIGCMLEITGFMTYFFYYFFYSCYYLTFDILDNGSQHTVASIWFLISASSVVLSLVLGSILTRLRISEIYAKVEVTCAAAIGAHMASRSVAAQVRADQSKEREAVMGMSVQDGVIPGTEGLIKMRNSWQRGYCYDAGLIRRIGMRYGLAHAFGSFFTQSGNNVRGVTPPLRARLYQRTELLNAVELRPEDYITQRQRSNSFVADERTVGDLGHLNDGSKPRRWSWFRKRNSTVSISNDSIDASNIYQEPVLVREEIETHGLPNSQDALTLLPGALVVNRNTQQILSIIPGITAELQRQRRRSTGVSADLYVIQRPLIIHLWTRQHAMAVSQLPFKVEMSPHCRHVLALAKHGLRLGRAIVVFPTSGDTSVTSNVSWVPFTGLISGTDIVTLSNQGMPEASSTLRHVPFLMSFLCRAAPAAELRVLSAAASHPLSHMSFDDTCTCLGLMLSSWSHHLVPDFAVGPVSNISFDLHDSATFTARYWPLYRAERGNYLRILRMAYRAAKTPTLAQAIRLTKLELHIRCADIACVDAGVTIRIPQALEESVAQALDDATPNINRQHAPQKPSPIPPAPVIWPAPVWVINGLPVTQFTAVFRRARRAHIAAMRLQRMLIAITPSSSDTAAERRDAGPGAGPANAPPTPDRLAAIIYDFSAAYKDAIECYDALFVLLGQIIQTSFDIGRPSLRALVAMDRLLSWLIPFTGDLLPGVATAQITGMPLGIALTTVHAHLIETTCSLFTRHRRQAMTDASWIAKRSKTETAQAGRNRPLNQSDRYRAGVSQLDEEHTEEHTITDDALIYGTVTTSNTAHVAGIADVDDDIGRKVDARHVKIVRFYEPGAHPTPMNITSSVQAPASAMRRTSKSALSSSIPATPPASASTAHHSSRSAYNRQTPLSDTTPAMQPLIDLSFRLDEDALSSFRADDLSSISERGPTARASRSDAPVVSAPLGPFVRNHNRLRRSSVVGIVKPVLNYLVKVGGFHNFEQNDMVESAVADAMSGVADAMGVARGRDQAVGAGVVNNLHEKILHLAESAAQTAASAAVSASTSSPARLRRVRDPSANCFNVRIEWLLLLASIIGCVFYNFYLLHATGTVSDNIVTLSAASQAGVDAYAVALAYPDLKKCIQYQDVKFCNSLPGTYVDKGADPLEQSSHSPVNPAGARSWPGMQLMLPISALDPLSSMDPLVAIRAVLQDSLRKGQAILSVQKKNGIETSTKLVKPFFPDFSLGFLLGSEIRVLTQSVNTLPPSYTPSNFQDLFSSVISFYEELVSGSAGKLGFPVTTRPVAPWVNLGSAGTTQESFSNWDLFTWRAPTPDSATTLALLNIELVLSPTLLQGLDSAHIAEQVYYDLMRAFIFGSLIVGVGLLSVFFSDTVQSIFYTASRTTSFALSAAQSMHYESPAIVELRCAWLMGHVQHLEPTLFDDVWLPQQFHTTDQAEKLIEEVKLAANERVSHANEMIATRCDALKTTIVEGIAPPSGRLPPLFMHLSPKNLLVATLGSRATVYFQRTVSLVLALLAVAGVSLITLVTISTYHNRAAASNTDVLNTTLTYLDISRKLSMATNMELLATLEVVGAGTVDGLMTMVRSSRTFVTPPIIALGNIGTAHLGLFHSLTSRREQILGIPIALQLSDFRHVIDAQHGFSNCFPQYVSQRAAFDAGRADFGSYLRARLHVALALAETRLGLFAWDARMTTSYLLGGHFPFEQRPLTTSTVDLQLDNYNRHRLAVNMMQIPYMRSLTNDALDAAAAVGSEAIFTMKSSLTHAWLNVALSKGILTCIIIIILLVLATLCFTSQRERTYIPPAAAAAEAVDAVVLAAVSAGSQAVTAAQHTLQVIRGRSARYYSVMSSTLSAGERSASLFTFLIRPMIFIPSIVDFFISNSYLLANPVVSSVTSTSQLSHSGVALPTLADGLQHPYFTWQNFENHADQLAFESITSVHVTKFIQQLLTDVENTSAAIGHLMLTAQTPDASELVSKHSWPVTAIEFTQIRTMFIENYNNAITSMYELEHCLLTADFNEFVNHDSTYDFVKKRGFTASLLPQPPLTLMNSLAGDLPPHACAAIQKLDSLSSLLTTATDVLPRLRSTLVAQRVVIDALCAVEHRTVGHLGDSSTCPLISASPDSPFFPWKYLGSEDRWWASPINYNWMKEDAYHSDLSFSAGIRLPDEQIKARTSNDCMYSTAYTTPEQDNWKRVSLDCVRRIALGPLIRGRMERLHESIDVLEKTAGYIAQNAMTSRDAIFSPGVRSVLLQLMRITSAMILFFILMNANASSGPRGSLLVGHAVVAVRGAINKQISSENRRSKPSEQLTLQPSGRLASANFQSNRQSHARSTSLTSSEPLKISLLASSTLANFILRKTRWAAFFSFFLGIIAALMFVNVVSLLSARTFFTETYNAANVISLATSRTGMMMARETLLTGSSHADKLDLVEPVSKQLEKYYKHLETPRSHLLSVSTFSRFLISSFDYGNRFATVEHILFGIPTVLASAESFELFVAASGFSHLTDKSFSTVHPPIARVAGETAEAYQNRLAAFTATAESWRTLSEAAFDYTHLVGSCPVCIDGDCSVGLQSNVNYVAPFQLTVPKGTLPSCVITQVPRKNFVRNVHTRDVVDHLQNPQPEVGQVSAETWAATSGSIISIMTGVLDAVTRWEKNVDRPLALDIDTHLLQETFTLIPHLHMHCEVLATLAQRGRDQVCLIIFLVTLLAFVFVGFAILGLFFHRYRSVSAAGIVLGSVFHSFQSLN